MEAVTKTGLKGEAGVKTSNLPAKSDLSSLKAQVDKLDIEKLRTRSTD